MWDTYLDQLRAEMHADTDHDDAWCRWSFSGVYAQIPVGHRTWILNTWPAHWPRPLL